MQKQQQLKCLSTVTDQSCHFDEIAVEFHCVWQGFKEVYTLEDLENYKDLLTAERYDQEIQKLNEQALAENLQ